jgi:hypothetical protein
LAKQLFRIAKWHRRHRLRLFTNSRRLSVGSAFLFWGIVPAAAPSTDARSSGYERAVPIAAQATEQMGGRPVPVVLETLNSIAALANGGLGLRLQLLIFVVPDGPKKKRRAGGAAGEMSEGKKT